MVVSNNRLNTFKQRVFFKHGSRLTQPSNTQLESMAKTSMLKSSMAVHGSPIAGKSNQQKGGSASIITGLV